MTDVKKNSGIPTVVTREAFEDARIIMDDDSNGVISEIEFASNADLAASAFQSLDQDVLTAFQEAQKFLNEKFTYRNFNLWGDFFAVREEREMLYIDAEGEPIILGAVTMSDSHSDGFVGLEEDTLLSGAIEAIGSGVVDEDGGPILRAEKMLEAGMTHDDVDVMLAKAVSKVNPQKLKNNCPSTAEATDRILKGEIGVYASGEDYGALPADVGVSSEPVSTARDILQWLPKSGDTAKLLLMGEINHVVNVVNIKGVLHVVDGQKGTSMTFRGVLLNSNVTLRLIPTSW